MQPKGESVGADDEVIVNSAREWLYERERDDVPYFV